jgi:hypothetical protein
MLSQKWLQKWDKIMDGSQNIVESNIKNLSMNLMNDQQEIVQKFIDQEMVYSALHEKKKMELFE